MKSSIALFTLSLLTCIGHPQNVSWKDTITVNDISEPGNPFRASGSAVVSNELTPDGLESASELTAVLTNSSPKAIMAFEAVIDLSPKYGGAERVTSRADYFFSSEPMLPNSTYPIKVSPHKGLQHWSHNTHPATLDQIDFPGGAHANVNVTFVLFADGSTFGKSDWALGLVQRRTSMTEIMSNLLNAFEHDKEAGLNSALRQEQAKPDVPSELSSSLGEIQEKLQKDGAGLTVQYLRDCIANARRNLELGPRQFVQ